MSSGGVTTLYFRVSFFRTGLLLMIWICLLTLFAEVSGEVVAPLDQGFFFDWTPTSARLPTPITAQCDTIKIRWGRGTATGPNPIAPFSLSIYLSTATVPLVVPAPGDPTFELDFHVPFDPDTQYQICMYDTNGVTGGCQDTYTVYSSPNSTSVGSSGCPNITMPQGYLGVEATTDEGPLSRYGWVNQCSDISFKPINGTPPYTLTIAPALRPPFNVTLQDAQAFNWTVSLGYGTPFFVSMVDSKGLGWSNGPLHSGGYGATDCLSVLGTNPHAKPLPPAVAVGSGIGGLAFGIILGLLVPLCIARCKSDKSSIPLERLPSTASRAPMLPNVENNTLPTKLQSSTRLRERIFGENRYQVTPFPPPTEDGHFQSRRSTIDGSLYGTVNSNSSTISFRANSPIASVISLPRAQSPLSMHARSFSEPRPMSPILANAVPSPPYSRNSTPVQADITSLEMTPSLYVLHHDGGHVPTPLYRGTDVVELPPQYPEVQALCRSRSPAPAQVSQPPRRPAGTHKRTYTGPF